MARKPPLRTAKAPYVLRDGKAIWVGDGGQYSFHYATCPNNPYGHDGSDAEDSLVLMDDGGD